VSVRLANWPGSGFNWVKQPNDMQLLVTFEYLDASSILHNNKSRTSNCPRLVVVRPSTTVFPLGAKRASSN